MTKNEVHHGPDGHGFYGAVTVGERGQISIPAQAPVSPQGIAFVKADVLMTQLMGRGRHQHSDGPGPRPLRRPGTGRRPPRRPRRRGEPVTTVIEQGVGNVPVHLMIFLSGAAAPLAVLPSGVQRVAELSPLTQLVVLMRRLWEGTDLAGVWVPVATLVGVLAVTLVVAAKRFRWK